MARMLQRKIAHCRYMYSGDSTTIPCSSHTHIFFRAYFRFVPDAAATVASILIRNLFSRSIPNRGDPNSANFSSRTRSPASKSEGQKGYQQVA